MAEIPNAGKPVWGSSLLGRQLPERHPLSEHGVQIMTNQDTGLEEHLSETFFYKEMVSFIRFHCTPEKGSFLNTGKTACAFMIHLHHTFKGEKPI